MPLKPKCSWTSYWHLHPILYEARTLHILWFCHCIVANNAPTHFSLQHCGASEPKTASIYMIPLVRNHIYGCSRQVGHQFLVSSNNWFVISDLLTSVLPNEHRTSSHALDSLSPTIVGSLYENVNLHWESMESTILLKWTDYTFETWCSHHIQYSLKNAAAWINAPPPPHPTFDFHQL